MPIVSVGGFPFRHISPVFVLSSVFTVGGYFLGWGPAPCRMEKWYRGNNVGSVGICWCGVPQRHCTCQFWQRSELFSLFLPLLFIWSYWTCLFLFSGDFSLICLWDCPQTPSLHSPHNPCQWCLVYFLDKVAYGLNICFFLATVSKVIPWNDTWCFVSSHDINSVEFK